jgi:hypothetical protein
MVGKVEQKEVAPQLLQALPQGSDAQLRSAGPRLLAHAQDAQRMRHEKGLIQAQPHCTFAISRQARFVQQAPHVGRRANAAIHVAEAQRVELVRHASIAAHPDSGTHEHALEL